MEIERIKKVIVDQKEEISEFFQREKIIAREIGIEKLRKFLKHPNVLVITGPRRSGKSTLATQIFKEERYGYLNFDDERLAGFSADDFSAAIQDFYDLYGENLECFIFDEIQNITGWELFISRLRRTKKIVITGSNAKLLSGDLATHLTGRYLEFTLYPFSFREFLKFKGIEIKKEDFYSTKKISRTKKHLNEYLAAGGFPEIFKFGSAIVGKIYDDVITKDILLRYGIKNKNAFRELSNYVISNFAQEISYANLGHIFSIKNVHTVKNYIEYLSSSFLILMLSKFSYKLKQQFITSKKAYGIDTGLVNSVAFQFSENSGKVMENAVMIDLKRRGDYFESGTEIYYWRDYSGKEVDFAVKKRNKITQLIQVCQNLANFKTKKREVKSLLKASEELHCNNLLIITSSEEGTENVGGKKIIIMPLWKWLLEML
ncbi:ATP-binding protein [Patescibacteria group bacterium]|nr:ATP-binding protein [Patescibacteria group bacterium]